MPRIIQANAGAVNGSEKKISRIVSINADYAAAPKKEKRGGGHQSCFMLINVTTNIHE